MTPLLESAFASDMLLTGVLTALSLIAVWLPFQRGLRTCFRARTATRPVGVSELRRCLETGSGSDSRLGLQLARVLRRSLTENAQTHPREFILDASRQYVVGEYETHYARMISMYANLLPPIGFIGTTAGLLILFLSMHLSNQGLELGALAVALFSSIFALMGFAVLEGLKIRLYGRLLVSLDEVFSLLRNAEVREERPARSAKAALQQA